MSTRLAQVVDDSIRRARQLAVQRAAAGIVQARFGQVEAVATWAARVLRSDEVQPYRLLYVIAERAN